MAKRWKLGVDVDTSAAQSKVEDLRDELERTAESGEEAGDAISEGFERSTGSVKKFTESLKDVESAAANAGDTAVGMVDGLLPGFSGALQGARAFTTGLKGMKAAIVGTGLGVLVVLLGSIVEWFQSSEKGARMLQIATGVLSQGMNILLNDVVMPLWESLKSLFEDPVGSLIIFYENLKQYVIDALHKIVEGVGMVGEALLLLFEGEFSQAWETAKKGVTSFADGITDLIPVTAVAKLSFTALVGVVKNVVSAVDDATKAVTNLVDAQEAYRKQQNQVAKESARLQGVIQQQMLIADNERKSYEERKAALEAAKAAELEMIRINIDLAKSAEHVATLEGQVATKIEEKREAQNKLAEATAGRIELENELNARTQEYAQQSVQMDLDEVRRKQEILRTISDARREAFDDSLEGRRDADLKQLAADELQNEREFNELLASEEEKEALRQAFIDARARVEREYARDAKDRAQSLQDKLLALELQSAGSSIEAQMQRDLADLRNQEKADLLELTNLKATEEEKNRLIEYYEKLRTKVEKDAHKERQALDYEARQKKIDDVIWMGENLINIADIFNNAQASDTEEAARRQFEINKKIQRAQVFLSTASGIMGQLAVPQDQLTGMNFVKAAIVAATGAAQLVAINSTTFDGGGGFDDSFDDGETSVQPVDLSFMQNRGLEGSMRAYVVNEDIQNAAMREQKISNQATLAQ